MLTMARGQPPLPDALPDALTTFQSMSWAEDSELWQYVDLCEVFTYLRGGKRLRIPERWASSIPKSFPGIS